MNAARFMAGVIVASNDIMIDIRVIDREREALFDAAQDALMADDPREKVLYAQYEKAQAYWHRLHKRRRGRIRGKK